MHFTTTAALLVLARSSLTLAQSSAANPGISAGTINTTAPDPCGPNNQLPGGAPGSKSTCDANVDTSNLMTGSYYGVRCSSISIDGMALDTTCIAAATSMCHQISGQAGPQYQQTNKWIWSQGGGACTFGYWLPEGGAPPPSFDRCYNQILSPVHNKCVPPSFNAGSVNIATFPGYANGSYETGVALDASYPSYLMLAQPSFCGVNGPLDNCLATQ